jgi:hypothetical protein
MVFFFSNFNNNQTLLEFSKMQFDEFLNYVLTRILKMKPSFLGFFILIFFQIELVGFW